MIDVYLRKTTCLLLAWAADGRVRCTQKGRKWRQTPLHPSPLPPTSPRWSLAPEISYSPSSRYKIVVVVGVTHGRLIASSRWGRSRPYSHDHPRRALLSLPCRPIRPRAAPHPPHPGWSKLLGASDLNEKMVYPSAGNTRSGVSFWACSGGSEASQSSHSTRRRTLEASRSEPERCCGWVTRPEETFVLRLLLPPR